MDIYGYIWYTKSVNKREHGFCSRLQTRKEVVFMIYATRKLGSAGRPPISEKVKDDVVRLFNQGYACREIADHTGLSRSSIYNIINERQEEKIYAR